MKIGQLASLVNNKFSSYTKKYCMQKSFSARETTTCTEKIGPVV